MKLGILASTLAALCLSAASCSSGKGDTTGALLGNISVDNTPAAVADLSQIFTQYSIISLETTDESLIGGRSSKVIKKSGRFYVQSINDVVVFDNQGKFVSRLSHVGSGPGEYVQLFDFDVVERYNEIWVSSANGIYRYDAHTMDFTGLIELPFFANRFKYLDNETIITCTPDARTFKVCAMDGTVLSDFFDADQANSMLDPVAFVKVGDIVASKLQESNDAVCYTPATGQFEMRNIVVPEDNLETAEINRDYFQQYGYFDQTDKVAEAYTGISSFRKVGDTSLVTLRLPDGKRSLLVSVDGSAVQYIFFPIAAAGLTNNVTPPTHPMFLNSLLCGESDDSFIFMFTPDDDPDSNPSILDVKRVKN